MSPKSIMAMKVKKRRIRNSTSAKLKSRYFMASSASESSENRGFSRAICTHKAVKDTNRAVKTTQKTVKTTKRQTRLQIRQSMTGTA